MADRTDKPGTRAYAIHQEFQREAEREQAANARKADEADVLARMAQILTQPPGL